MVTMAERVAFRFAVDRLARGVSPNFPQGAQIRRVLQDLDRAKIFTDFDLLSGLFESLGRSPVVGPDVAQESKRLSHSLHAVHEYMRTYVLDLVIEAGNIMETLNDQTREAA